MEYFKYMYDLLKEKGAPHIKIYGGGGGVILPREIDELHEYGIAGIFHRKRIGADGLDVFFYVGAEIVVSGCVQNGNVAEPAGLLVRVQMVEDASCQCRQDGECKNQYLSESHNSTNIVSFFYICGRVEEIFILSENGKAVVSQHGVCIFF